MRTRRSGLSLFGLTLALFTLTAASFRWAADFGGVWDVTVEGPQGAVAIVMTLAQKSDSVSGTLESELGTAPLAGAVRGDSLEFAFGLSVDGQTLDITALGALTEKDKIAGRMVVTGMGEFPFAGQRKKGD